MPKKKTALTIEERLQQALVPAEEQPYEVPENWVWVRLGSLYEVNPKNKAADELDAAFIPMEKISAGMLSEYSYETQEWCKAKKGHTQFADGDVAFAKISPCFENRKSMMLNNLPNSIGGGTTELIILRNASINQKYTFWLVSDERFIRGGVQTYSGTVGQQRINMDYVRSYPVPLPPLSEQQRIVERIEELFAKLDEAKERLQEVADSFAVRKAAILHKAFTGELTKQWRLENGVSDESWEEKTIGDIAQVKGGKRIPKGMSLCFENTGHPYIKAGNLKNGTVIDESMMYVSDEVLKYIKNYTVSAGDVYITNVGACIGDCGIIPEKYDGANLTENAVKLTDINCNNKFLHLFLASEQTQSSIKESIASATLGKLSIANIKKIIVFLPTLPEQHEIVRLIDDLLARERAAQQATEQALVSIDLMKKSILARAFRGELGTNKASEASALELLRQVLAEN